LQPQVVKQALMILLQHSCVHLRQNKVVNEQKVTPTQSKQEQSQPDTTTNNNNNTGSTPPLLVSYFTANVTGVIQRLRFAEYISFAHGKYASIGEMLITHVIEEGRVTKKKALETAKNIHASLNGMNPEQHEQDVAALFDKMIEEDYLVNAKVDADDLLEQHQCEKIAEDASIPKKKGKSALKPDEEKQWVSKFGPPLLESKEPYFKINYLRFNISLTVQSCVDLVKQKFDEMSSRIISAAFDIVGPQIKFLDVEFSHNFTLEELKEKLGDYRGYSNTVDIVKYLDDMEKSSLQVVSKANAQKLSPYRLHIGVMLHALKQQFVESVVHNKFGKISARIFRILSQNKILDEKTISNLAMIGPRDTSELMFDMLTKQFVQLQEVPKSNDRSSARTFFLYYVDFDAVSERIRGEMFKNIKNLKIKMNAIINNNIDLINAAESLQNIDTKNNTTQQKASLSRSDQEKLKKLRAVEEQIEHSILHLCHSLLQMGV